MGGMSVPYLAFTSCGPLLCLAPATYLCQNVIEA